MPANVEKSALATGLERSFSLQSPKKVISKNVQLPQSSTHLTCYKCNLSKQVFNSKYINCEIPYVQAGFRKGRGTRDPSVNICWIVEKGIEFEKNTYFCFIDHEKTFDCVDHNKLWKTYRDGNIRPSYLPSEKSVCRSRCNS